MGADPLEFLVIPLFDLALCFVLVGSAYDFFSRCNVHKVYWAGAAIIVMSVPLRLAISGTPMWRSVAEWLTR